MSEIKSQDSFSEIAIMASDPLEDYTPDIIRDVLTRYQTDEAIAAIMAAVANKTGWLGHDIDDPDNDEDINSRIIEEHDAWWVLEKELYVEIIRRLEEENRTKGTAYVTAGIGLRYIIKPFMERNGYIDGAGWWVKK